MSLIKGIFFLCLLSLAIGFALYNDELISLQYYFGWQSIPLPLFLWAFLALIIGLVVSGIYAFITKINLHARVRQLRRNVAEMEKKRIPPSPPTG